MTKEKQPRQYAAEIIKSNDRNERRRMLYSVPDGIRELVKEHVEDYFKKRKLTRKKMIAG
jgi:hypothetical protein